jgi:hypothetical protein
MATTAVLSQGSAFYVLDDTVASPAIVRQIKQTKGITGLGGSRTVIETTNLDSTAKDKSPGLMDSGSISFDLVENPADLSHQLLESLANTGTKPSKQFYFGLSDGLATVPAFTGTFAAPPLVLTTPKNTAVGTGSTATTVLTISAMTSGAFAVGMGVSGGTMTAGTIITSFGTGTGQTGTYNISISQTVSSTTITGVANARTGYLFTGFIKQYSRDVAANGVVLVKGAIEITGPVFTAINGLAWTA